MDKYSIGKKKADDLYAVVHEEVMQARIAVRDLLTPVPGLADGVDDLLSELCYQAPQKAIDMFKVKTKDNG